ncbi:hypothetical protein LGH83_15555 [Lichenihabitans sp. PAMC28606]|uniref:hypothetical protein n=1 Tax=Lichenihabitans sp. PAMC28606 TaxID=2880932 RepID=UPI001D0A07C5|nr:hypothetical protein [Lichenihabitans sp. PAMC28606]UDL93959.1 hypothetical protein LGH83_15555 [Lichenihabitans sp. PAMC28606]
MNDQPEQFKKTPRRKGDKGKSVTVSAEAKQAYLAIIQERDELQARYAQYLPATETRR